MADIKLSALPAAAAAADADKLVSLQSGVVVNQTASALKTYMMGAPGAIGGTTPAAGAFTTISATGAITSTLATGTAPLTVASTTNVANLNASSLSGATMAVPGAIGGTTPAAGTFTVLTANTSAALTSPTFAAGSATAGSWPIHTPGSTLLTSAVAGAVEVDATNFYATTEASNRGVIGVDHFIIAATTRTFTSNTNVQAIFSSPANGTLTLGTGTYLFETMFCIDTMSATSGNGKFALLGAGTATLGNILYATYAADAAFDAIGTWVGVATASATSSSARLATAGTATVLNVFAKGSVVVSVAGTLIPSFQLETAASAVVKVGSYFTCRRIGSSSVVSVGNWS